MRNNLKIILFPIIFILLFFAFLRFTKAAELHINCCQDNFFAGQSDSQWHQLDHPRDIYIDSTDPTHYGITNAPPNSYVLWSSTRDGIPVEENCFYSQQVGSNGTVGPIAGSAWQSGDISENWTKTVEFTDTQPVVNSCNNAPAYPDTASKTFKVSPHVTVNFDAKMDNGSVEFSLNNSGIHYNYSIPLSDWHKEDIQSGFTRPLFRDWWSASFPAPPASFPYPGYIPSGYDNAALIGITSEDGGDPSNPTEKNIWVGGIVSNQYLDMNSDGQDDFTAHYRNTRIKVLSNQALLGGTYSITPDTSVTPGSPVLPGSGGFALNTTYYGMPVNTTYEITYTPGPGEAITGITKQLCGGGYPTENCNAASTESGNRTSYSLLNHGSLIIFTLNIVKPTVDIKANNSDGPIEIESGSSATISWTSSNVSSCVVSPTSWTGTSNSGISTGSLTSSRTYAISCDSGAATDSVTVNITAPEGTPATLDIGPTALNFSGVACGAGSTNPLSQTVNVMNVGSSGTTFNWTSNVNTTSGGNWLSISPISGNSLGGSNSQTVTVSVNVSGLTTGTYAGAITFFASNDAGSKTVNVTLTLSAPAAILFVDPLSLGFSAAQGGANPSSKGVAIKNTGCSSSSLLWTATKTETAPWLLLSAPILDNLSGGNSAILTVNVDTTGLVFGSYTAPVTVSATSGGNPTQGSPKTVMVTLDVFDKGATITLSCTNDCKFAVANPGDTPSPQTLTIGNTGNIPLYWLLDKNAFWLTPSAISGGPVNPGGSAMVVLSVNTANMQDGNYIADVNVSGNALNSPQTQNVTLTIGGAPQAIIECNDQPAPPDCIINQGESIEFLNKSTP